ncbi:MAG: hypothetical protein IT446_16125 [Phycisphaerales bacterium]|nr:hypothetical protein [Phycisphaerales bacterium]
MIHRSLSLRLLVCLIALFAPAAPAGTRSATFGLDWVKSHPFTLMALTQRGEAVSGNNLYSQAGMNTMLAWKDRAPIFQSAIRQHLPWIFHLDSRKGPLSDDLKTYLSGVISKYPGCVGLQVWDEPKLPEMSDIGKIVAWLKQAHPNLLVYSNLNPIPNVGDPRYCSWRAGLPVEGYEQYPYSYDDSIHDYLKIVQPDLLMTDIYPFWSPQELDPEQYLLQKYFLNLTLIRQAALEANIPYWMFVQAYQDQGRCRMPSESDLRMQVYSTLAYGFTGIAYYTYDPVEEGSMLDAKFQPSAVYQAVRQLNEEVKRLGNSLRQLRNVAVRYVPGRHDAGGQSILNSTPNGLEAYRPRSWDATTIVNVILEQPGANKNALIGFFEDDQGGLYFMIVNLTHGENLSARETTLPITITMAPWVKNLSVLSRETGRSTPVELKDGKLRLELPGGTGDLYRVGQGPFRGVR